MATAGLGLSGSRRCDPQAWLSSSSRSALAVSPSLPFLELLDESTLPQNSDAVLILGQWLAAMAQFKSQHYEYDNSYGDRRWFTAEDAEEVAEWEESEGNA